MDVGAVKLDVIQKLMGITQASLLKKISTLIDEEMIVGYTADGKPLTKEAYNKRLEEAEQQLRAGAYTSQEDMEKEAENW